MTVHTDMQAYYTQRAAMVDCVVESPVQKADLAPMRQKIGNLLSGLNVLELACGTGYWTPCLAQSAARVLAIDSNPAVLTIARTKHLPNHNVVFMQADAYALQSIPAQVDLNACFAGGWWSHVPRARQVAWLDGLRDYLKPGAQLVMLDDIYVEGHSTPIARTDADGNTYQICRLPNNERYEILKNFPTDSNLRKRLSGHLKEIRIERLEHYWLLSGRIK